jgi:hypothetical protein
MRLRLAEESKIREGAKQDAEKRIGHLHLETVAQVRDSPIFKNKLRILF